MNSSSEDGEPVVLPKDVIIPLLLPFARLFAAAAAGYMLTDSDPTPFGVLGLAVGLATVGKYVYESETLKAGLIHTGMCFLCGIAARQVAEGRWNVPESVFGAAAGVGVCVALLESVCAVLAYANTKQ